MPGDQPRPEEDYDDILRSKYSKPPPPFKGAPEYEPPTFYEKDDVENEQRLQNLNLRSKALNAVMEEGCYRHELGGNAHYRWVQKEDAKLDQILKEKAKGTVWDSLSFVTQIALVGLVCVQFFRGGKWISEWIWKKANEAEAEERRREFMARFQEAWKRMHARDMMMHNFDDDEI